MKHIWVFVFFLSIFIFGIAEVEAASHYVRAGATGANNGADWSNAYTSLPISFVRGDTYYIADGTYAESHNLNTPISGTAVITIKKATVADHGTSTGWVDSYGDGQVVFNNGFTFATSYWVLDGVTGGGPGQWESNFGFFINMPASGGQDATFRFGNGVTSITVQHVDVYGRGRLYGYDTDIFYITDPISNLTIRYCFLRDTSRTMILTWPAKANGILIEFTKFSRNGPAEHREAWSAGPDDNVVVRYNLFEDIFGTGVIAIVNNIGDAANWEIYGNVFYHTGKITDGIINTGLIVNRYDAGGSPIAVSATNWKVYNNTIANIRNGSFTTAIDAEQFTNYTVYNNIWYNNNGISGANGTTGDYNWFYANNSNNTSGAHDIVGSANPFQDTSPWLTGNWTLKTGIPGYNLGQPYGSDYLGKTRGADGAWDRGALEFGSAGNVTPPPAPMNLKVQ